jgi:non-ribosomal peptide synthetase-like protein
MDSVPGNIPPAGGGIGAIVDAGVLRGPRRPDLIRDEVLADIFCASAAARPDRPALTGPEGTQTYGQVNAASDAIARGLIRRGIGPRSIVGLWMRRGQALLIAQIAITKAGAAWLPFDADIPVERITNCLCDSGAQTLLTSNEFAHRIAATGVRVITADALVDPSDDTEVNARAAGLTPDHPAYLIYTAGSTGSPKGVIVSHRNICHCLRASNVVFGLSGDDVMCQTASVAFDLSLEEIWVPYLVGASLWVATPELIAEPDRLNAILAKTNITAIDTVPTLLSLLTGDFPSLRLVITGGEPLPQTLAERWTAPGRRVFNSYGPTETTVVATAADVSNGEPITIGRPIANYTCYVVDENTCLLPPGVQGELLIGGPGVAQGYLGRPDLTAKNFIRNPFVSDGSDPVLYRTSDAVSVDSRGLIHFHGRLDDQCKIRGFRVEVSEIEAALAGQPGVVQAAVVLRQSAGIDQLVAFMVQTAADAVDPFAIRRVLTKQLPPYMVPARFEIVSALPKLVSGKVDRQFLKERPLSSEVGLKEEQEQPRTETEAVLLAAAQAVFPGQILPLDADFFTELGGHSLLAARFVSMVRQTAALATMTMQDVYMSRSLRAMAERLDGRSWAGGPVEHDLSFTPPPLLRRFLCGLAQAAALPFVFGLEAVQWLGLFLASVFLLPDGSSLFGQLPALLAIYMALNLGTKLLIIGLKWIIVGRTKPGRYPLWGVYYYRVWLVNRLLQINSAQFLQASPLIRWYLRALGARIGQDSVIGEFEAGAWDLISVGDRSCVGLGSRFANVEYSGNVMVIGRVEIGANVHVGNSCVFGLDCQVQDGADLADLSAVTSGSTIGAWERWDGSPARKVGAVDRDKLRPYPLASTTRRATQALVYVLAYAVILMLGLVPIFPAFYVLYNLDEWLEGVSDYTVTWVNLPLLAWPTAIALIVVTAVVMIGVRWFVLPTRMKPGDYSIYSWFYVRKWIVSLGSEVVLETVSSLYATLFIPIWYRLLGTKIGRGSEISTNLAGRYDLIDIGENNFLGDELIFGDEDIRNGWMTLGAIQTGERVFIGNSAVVAAGGTIEDDALIGVKSKLPDDLHVRRGETYFGSPAIKLPNRQRITVGPQWTYRPPCTKIILRGLFEALHTSLPTAVYITLGYMTADLIEEPVWDGRWLTATGIFLAAGVVIAAALVALSVAAKWLMIGVYKPVVKPMWSFWAMRTEAVAVLYGGLAGTAAIEFLRGTPFLPWILRLYGTKIGKGVCMELTDLTEFDCVNIGDYCTLNATGCLQTHLYEDRVMKVGRVKLGKGVHVGWDATVLYDTHIGDFAKVGPLTLVMKGEMLPAHTEWIGVPAVSVAAPSMAVSEHAA